MGHSSTKNIFFFLPVMLLIPLDCFVNWGVVELHGICRETMLLSLKMNFNSTFKTSTTCNIIFEKMEMLLNWSRWINSTTIMYYEVNVRQNTHMLKTTWFFNFGFSPYNHEQIHCLVYYITRRQGPQELHNDSGAWSCWGEIKDLYYRNIRHTVHKYTAFVLVQIQMKCTPYL